MDIDWTIVKKRRRYRHMDQDDSIDGENPSGSSSNKKAKKNPKSSESDSSSRVTRNGNHIYFYAGVSKVSVYRMYNHMQKIESEFNELQRNNPNVEMKPAPIIIHINSFGGGVFAAFNAIDLIKQ